eukprot:TRINITY_DN4770_c0_g1_i1.p1 TRINITY_DN4770_c0_g1~~TRINITY_DN4770_c0_g1_i1.p1  ORF type:complete len:120 (-),score=36.54 TRINITY_DN4770_c0_g1_i1:356-715(-)
MSSSFRFNLADLTPFLLQVKAQQAHTLAEKSAFYNFDFELEEPLEESTDAQVTQNKPRFTWEPLHSPNKLRASLKQQIFSTQSNPRLLTLSEEEGVESEAWSVAKEENSEDDQEITRKS